MTTDTTHLLGVPELAERMRVPHRTVYDLVRSGRLRHVRVGRHIRVSEEMYAEFINSTSEAA